jgi:hypothetical protein
MKRACILFALAACATDPDPITYTGESRRFVVDSIRVPLNNTEAREFGADLNGDRTVDNQLGMVLGTLSSLSGNVTTHGDEMIAAGTIMSSLELVADDFTTDDTVALRYFAADGDTADLIGGELDGAFTTTTTGAAAVMLPVFVDSDPIVLPLVRMRATLTPDGRGGFDASIQGAVAADVARKAAFDGIAQMFATRPSDHVLFFRLLDKQPYDYKITLDEFENNDLIESLLAPDLDTDDGVGLLSIGFRVHVSPCAQGRCLTTQPAPTCFDRVRNGAETDVDCGGACGSCGAGFACSDAGDCQTGSCDGTCAAPTCSDGVRDGFETDVDCGSECGDCAVGQACYSNIDCASGQCGPPCTGTLCGDYSLDTCR